MRNNLDFAILQMQRYRITFLNKTNETLAAIAAK